MKNGTFVYCQDHARRQLPAVVRGGGDGPMVRVEFSDGVRAEWPLSKVVTFVNEMMDPETAFDKEQEKAMNIRDSDFKRDALKMVKEANASLARRAKGNA